MPVSDFGPAFCDDGSVAFRVFAPACAEMGLCLGDSTKPLAMESDGDGFFSLKTQATPGDRYRFQLPNGDLRPDPASRFQPDGVHGASELIDVGQFDWRSDDWRGIAKADLILYELHVGTFTDEGTYAAATNRLDELVALGITAVELMPLAQAGGDWNWGYDGVNFFAPCRSYGRPEELAAFVDAAHAGGLAVILDVVYNHLGPEGNYLGQFGGYVSQKHKTPWGDAPNFDGDHSPAIRDYILENVRYWIEDFRFDGIRVDATHCIPDTSQPHIVRELGEQMARLEARLGRQLHLIAESNVYDPELLAPLEESHGSGFGGLWCDDFVHSVFAVLQPGEHMTPRNYEPGADLDLILKRGYVFQGTLSEKHTRHLLEDYPHQVGMESLVVSIQHHDFIGNHPRGLRLHQITSPSAHRAAAALLLLSPSIPMLFMGEEFACDSPFYFFVDFADKGLRKAVEQGRMAEHPQHDWEDVVSPVSPEAFTDSKIGPAANGDAETLAWYRELIALRKSWIAAGILTRENFEAHWDADQLAHLVYRTENEEHSVIIRLHPVGSEIRPVKVTVQGDVLLSPGYDTASRKAGAFAVIVCRGTLTLS